MKAQDAYEALEAALDCLKAYNCMTDERRAAGWLEVAIGWIDKAKADARIERASLYANKKEVAA